MLLSCSASIQQSSAAAKDRGIQHRPVLDEMQYMTQAVNNVVPTSVVVGGVGMSACGMRFLVVIVCACYVRHAGVIGVRASQVQTWRL
jgi:hypothetical protein